MLVRPTCATTRTVASCITAGADMTVIVTSAVPISTHASTAATAVDAPTTRIATFTLVLLRRQRFFFPPLL